MSDNEFVRVAFFDSETEATLAKAILDEHNIHSTLSGLEPSALELSLDGDDTIELFVLQEDFEAAKKWLADIAAADEEESNVPAWTCACGEEVDEGFWVCWNCGSEYKKV